MYQLINLHIFLSLVVHRKKTNIPWINLIIISDKSSYYIHAANFFREPGHIKFEAIYFQNCSLTSLQLALFDANHSELFSHLRICDFKHTPVGMVACFPCTSTSGWVQEKLKIGWMLTFFNFRVWQSIWCTRKVVVKRIACLMECSVSRMMDVPICA